MSYKDRLIKLYDKVGGVHAGWIETFKNVTEPYSEDRLDSIIDDLDNMADWQYDINDVRAIVVLEREIQRKFEEKFEVLEQMVEDLKSPNQIEKAKSEFEPLLDAIEYSYITLGSNYQNYSDRIYRLTEE